MGRRFAVRSGSRLPFRFRHPRVIQEEVQVVTCALFLHLHHLHDCREPLGRLLANGRHRPANRAKRRLRDE
jgi:hypothetical protein